MLVIVPSYMALKSVSVYFILVLLQHTLLGILTLMEIRSSSYREVSILALSLERCDELPCLILRLLRPSTGKVYKKTPASYFEEPKYLTARVLGRAPVRTVSQT